MSGNAGTGPTTSRTPGGRTSRLLHAGQVMVSCMGHRQGRHGIASTATHSICRVADAPSPLCGISSPIRGIFRPPCRHESDESRRSRIPDRHPRRAAAAVRQAVLRRGRGRRAGGVRQARRRPGRPDEVVGWLYRVVRNGAIDAARVSRRRKAPRVRRRQARALVRRGRGRRPRRRRPRSPRWSACRRSSARRSSPASGADSASSRSPPWRAAPPARPSAATRRASTALRQLLGESCPDHSKTV